MPIEPGTRVGPFEVLSSLGVGGMGEVYHARDTRLGREVAVKALPEKFAQDGERLARFRREAQALASLNHPNIATIYGLEETDGRPHLVLELVDGGTLAARLEKGALPTAEAVRICEQIAAGVEAAHERGIVHRDLKPGNVMITNSGVVKVLDFGLAKCETETEEEPAAGDATRALARPATTAGTILGTGAYMSPEQARGQEVDRRTDVWSFGCILFECLAGRAVFRGETFSDLLAQVLEREPEWSVLPPSVPARLRDVLRRCLRKEAADRPRDIRDVRLELVQIAGGCASSPSEDEQSIAVLPFNNLSGPDDEYFADGMTDEILNSLARLDGLRVAARTSCFAFKGRREDLRRVGEELNVRSVLEGTVRRAGRRLRITVQLVNAADGYQLWSERYDREMTDVFELQDEIASAIAERLRGTLRSQAEKSRVRRGTKSLEAFELFLRGRALQYQRGKALYQAIPCFECAIDLDPDYADALAWLADSYRLLGTYGAAPSREVMPRARIAAERALAVDPDSAEALATLADIEMQFDHDGRKAQATWARALAADPGHSRARCERALWGAAFGLLDLEAALEETRRAAESDPLNSWVAGMQSLGLGFAGRHEESIREARRAAEIDPHSFLAQWGVVHAVGDSGDYAGAIALAPELLASTGRHVWSLGTVGWLHGKMGQAEMAGAVLDELAARARHEFVAPFWPAGVAAAAGRLEDARIWVERALDQREPLVCLARFLSHWDGVRQAPWFEELVGPIWR